MRLIVVKIPSQLQWMLDYVSRLTLALDLGLVMKITARVLLQKQATNGGMKNSGIILENLDSRFVSQSSIFAKEMDTKMEGDDGNVEHNQPTCSSMTDSSNGSGSMMHGSISSSSSFEERKHSKVQTSFAGCFQLYKEVSKRFKLQTGTFQLKYLDDEEEWVLLVSDSDLQECLEIMEDVGTRNVKFLVCDAAAPFCNGKLWQQQ
ncbi:hypothetical protein OIU84_027955 [Salix udensis]|uniref:PB1 domain-containing protein n=1 Tax=Salix udensis TaxID=889485 RepID=A0AAD6KBR8_9ROSI|nr:hypothetical protein OIU84_027955 [Salix udensis]